MKNPTKFTRWQNQVLALVSAVLLFSCSHLEPFQMEGDDVLLATNGGSPTSQQDIIPFTLDSDNGGNIECGQIDSEFELKTSGRADDDNGLFDDTFEWPDGFTITHDGTFVTWSYDPSKNNNLCIQELYIIVKGSNNANIYQYGAGINGDSGLAAPVFFNRQGKRIQPELSNLTLCYALDTCDDEDDPEICRRGTAWAANDKPGDDRYIPKGNWATYITFEDGKEYNIYLGQTNFIGTVTLKEKGNDVKMKFNLSSGGLQDVNNNVKIQGYSNPPSGNPAPGSFAHKFYIEESIFEVTIPKEDYYGIHLDAFQLCE
ncbi:hypothetical protein KI659_01125 [Litoribacter alkaliphilus]|uniref:Uncharacterized protein n=1 Tax=Litoribacter ruber TaxID=702568 RepID=A0AAP2CE71_9BACT|nr:hypothetical protein [Litoribacter alkaliphilus]MBS9522603.1 hypothetical protein [Litoribacter alkaliphilus]